MDQTTKDRLTDRNIWARVLYMLLFVIAYAVAEVLLTVVVVFQFIAALVTGRINESLHRFGANLSTYVYQILQFATFNDERLPYPFSDWPDEKPGASPWSADAEAATAPPTEPSAPEQSQATPDTPRVDDGEVKPAT